MLRVRACDPRVQFERNDRTREKKHVVVTGAAGFVGFHAAQALRRRGDSVVGVDVFSSYYPTQLKRSRERKLKEIGVEVVEADVNDEERMQELLDGKTHVLHLAAQPGVRYASRDAKSYVNANLGGFVSIMEASRKGKGSNGIPLVVYASSSSVYGDASCPPFQEDEVACQPLSLYAATKRANELIAHVYSHTHGIKCTGLRFFTVYGPWGRPDMAVSSFTKKILKGETIRIFQGPNGSELGRDFTYIDDIVDGCLGAIDTAGDGQYRIYNLGNTQPITVTELVRALEMHLNKRAITKYVPLPDAGDVLFTHADISLAKKDLGYEPRVPFEEGIRRSVEWYLEYHGIDGTNATADEWDYEPY